MARSSRLFVVGIVVVIVVVAALALVLRQQLRCAGFPGAGVSAAELPPAASATELRIAEFNVRNFPLDERPETPDLPYARRTNICDLEAVLAGLDADVVGLAEIRDPRRFLPILQRASSDRSYHATFAANGGRFGQRVGVAWDTRRLELRGDPVEIAEVAVAAGERSGIAVRLATRQPQPLDLTVVQVHLAAGVGAAATRRRQVAALADWLEDWIATTGDPDVVVQGDFNTAGLSGGAVGDELVRLEGLLAAAGLRRLPNASGCSQYWEGSRGDGVLKPSLLDHVWLGGLGTVPPGAEVESWLHCRRAACGPLVSRPGAEDATFWDVSDHCPITFAIPLR